MRRALPALLLLAAVGLSGCGGDPDNGAAQEQLTQTCACILGKVEQEYSEAAFAAFEQRLLGGSASEQESDRLVSWSTECARGAAG